MSSIVLLFDPSSSIVLHFDHGCPPQWRTGPRSTKAQTVPYGSNKLARNGKIEKCTRIARISEKIGSANKFRCIFSDRAVKSCPKKLPNYAGRESEKFSIFRDQFTEAAKDNRVPRSDQADKLREVLTDRDLQHLPRAFKDIDEAWLAPDTASVATGHYSTTG